MLRFQIALAAALSLATAARAAPDFKGAHADLQQKKKIGSDECHSVPNGQFKTVCEMKHHKQVALAICTSKSGKDYGPKGAAPGRLFKKVYSAAECANEIKAELAALAALGKDGLTVVPHEPTPVTLTFSDGHVEYKDTSAYLVEWIPGTEVKLCPSGSDNEEAVLKQVASLVEAAGKLTLPHRKVLLADLEKLHKHVLKSPIPDLQGIVDSTTGHFFLMDPFTGPVTATLKQCAEHVGKALDGVHALK